MKNLYLLLVFISFSFTAIAQVEIDPGSIHFVSDGEQVELKPLIHNHGDEDINLYWMFEPADDFPMEWSVVICDVQLCYPPGTEKSSPANPNLVPANGSIEISFTVACNDVAGDSYGVITFFDDVNCENTVAVSSIPTSIQERFDESVLTYPNPVTEYLSIKNDENVHNIEIRDITGNLLFDLQHKFSKVHDISMLNSGVYFLTMTDEFREITKTTRMIKM